MPCVDLGAGLPYLHCCQCPARSPFQRAGCCAAAAAASLAAQIVCGRLGHPAPHVKLNPKPHPVRK